MVENGGVVGKTGEDSSSSSEGRELSTCLVKCVCSFPMALDSFDKL